MTEYLIKRTDGEWFDLHVNDFNAALRPLSFPSQRVDGQGEWRIRTLDVDIAFYYEDPGIQICIEGDLAEDVRGQLVDEFRQNIELATGQKGTTIDLNKYVKSTSSSIWDVVRRFFRRA